MLSDFWRSVRLDLIGRSADILFFTLLVIQKELGSPNCLRILHIVSVYIQKVRIVNAYIRKMLISNEARITRFTSCCLFLVESGYC